MRSRYAAFALKLVPYLYDTMHSEFEDRKRPRNEVLRGLRNASESFRYVGLKILEAQTDADDQRGWVLFHARLFERARDRSFVELSEFRREAGQWKYYLGHTTPHTLIKSKLDTLTIDSFFTAK
jgi:SEC-C motif-containing protein